VDYVIVVVVFMISSSWDAVEVAKKFPTKYSNVNLRNILFASQTFQFILLQKQQCENKNCKILTSVL